MKDARLIPIKSDVDFETLCCDIAKEKYGDYEAQKYGRRGQKQWGVDIVASDRKNENEKVVIQCKYKSNPLNFSGSQADKERKKVQKEIRSEFDAAFEKHEFERFIFASNIKTDRQLQDFAEELSKEKRKEIKIWFIDDIKDEILSYRRLLRLYSENSPKTGVELIDKDFIDQLNYSAQVDCNSTDKINIKTNIFRFYSGCSAQNEQWFGVLNKLDSPRECLPLINKQIEELFKKDFLDCKVGALVYGEGGCGKSTLLRRIAIDIPIKNKRYTNWWVEDIDVFMDYESSCISDNPDQKHIVFIDDWYRNKPEDKGRRFFRWVKQQSNVLVLIGDRKNNGTYKQHLYGNNAFNLKPSENIKILEHISGRSPDLKKFINKLQDEEKFLNNISIFIVLFVIAYLYENEKKEGGFDLKDGVQSKFQRIIAKKLLDLENDDRYQGLGKALYLIAEIYADPALNYFIFLQESFLKIANLLGNNTELEDRININGFPEQVKSLLHTKIATAKNGIEYKKIYFNHDVMAEEGVIYANNIYSELKLELELFDLKELFKHLTGQCDLTGSLMLWLWLYTIKLKNNTGGDELLAIIRKDLDLIPGGLLVYIIKNKVTSEFKKKICKTILEQDAFFKLPYQIVSTALNILQNEGTGQTAAKTILEQDAFFKLPDSIVSTALKILQNEGTGQNAAKTILEQDAFFKLPYPIVSTALKILQDEGTGQTAAKTILEQDAFFKLPDSIVSTALKILQNEGTGQTAAKTILEQDAFFKLPDSIVSTALKILQNEGTGQNAAKTILEQDAFFKLPYQIVSTALKILQDEGTGQTAAKTILEQDAFFKLPDSIVSTALKILQDEGTGQTAAKTILEQDAFFKLPDSIVSTALKILQNEGTGQTAAKTILEQDAFFKLPYQIVSTALKILQDEETGQTAAKTILEQDAFFKLPDSIVSTALKILQDEGTGQTAAKTILEQDAFFKLPDSIVSTALKILQNEETGQTAAKTILEQDAFFKLSQEIVSTALKILQDEGTGQTAAKTILEQDAFFKLSQEIVSTALKILQNEETGQTAAKTILEQDAFFKLPYPIVSTALKILQNEETGQTAAKTILEQDAFFKLPYPIVSTALKILQNEETGKTAAKTILERGFKLSTFLLFNAIKVLSNSEKNADRHLTEIFVKDIYDKIKYPKKTKGFVRLYYDLLYIPLMDIPAHRERILNIIKSYHPKLVRNKKYNIFQVLKCYSDYPDIKYYKTEIISLCKRILEKWHEDVQYQFAKNPHELIFGHIDLAFSFAEPKELSLKAAKEIVSYGGIDKNFKRRQLYKTAINIINTVEFT